MALVTAQPESPAAAADIPVVTGVVFTAQSAATIAPREVVNIVAAEGLSVPAAVQAKAVHVLAAS
jgi:hypothetical protein